MTENTILGLLTRSQWPTAVAFRRSALEAAGVEVVPTFRTPHVTLAATMLAELVDRLVNCGIAWWSTPTMKRRSDRWRPDERHDNRPHAGPQLRGRHWAPLGFVDEAQDPSRIGEGAWIIVGSGTARAVAQVADIDGEIVHVRPLPGPVSRYRHLLGPGAA